MNINFNNVFRELEVRDTISSIFDLSIAGQLATDGNYYIICTHEDSF